MIKTLFDFVASFLLILFSLPIIFVLCIVIRINMGRPVFFIQRRPGLNEKSFNFYKLRTMTNDKNDEGNLLTDNNRITKLGSFLRRTSLDELPSLLNVIKGDMSLVGPRPLLVEYLDYYSDEQSKRHNVKPGVTGWAQINGRNNISWNERLELDIWYIKNRSFLLDIKILIITIFKVLKSEGINKSELVTMEKFSKK